MLRLMILIMSVVMAACGDSPTGPTSECPEGFEPSFVELVGTDRLFPVCEEITR